MQSTVENKLAFDIGANIGFYTEWMVNNGFSKIIAVEPSNRARRKLRKKYRRNKGIHILDTVISSDNKEIDFWDCYPHSSISTASESYIKNSRFAGQYRWKRRRKNSRTLDSLILEYGVPDLVKIDTEGYEYEVLKGLSQNGPRVITFEWHEEDYEILINCLNHLTKIGYETFMEIPRHDDLNLISNSVWVQDWRDLKLHSDIDIVRKENWGMIAVSY